MLISFLVGNDCVASNTFRKGIAYLATRRRWGVQIDATVQRPTHEQLDYIVIQHRWTNAIKNVEAHHNANIHLDHFPLKAELIITPSKYRKTLQEAQMQ